jgi:hypothetical protein
MSDHYSDFYEKHYKDMVSRYNNQDQSNGTEISFEVEKTGCFQMDLFDIERNNLGNHFFDMYIVFKKFSKKFENLTHYEKKFLTSILK